MKIIFGFFIFCLVLFLYLHIQFHLKTSDDLEIYEMDQPSKEKLEDVCDIRQPVLFDFDDSKNIIETTNREYILFHYPSFEMKIRNINDHDMNSELFIPLPLHSSIKLFDEDKKGSYYSENNSDFLQETGVIKHFQYNDSFLRPYMVSNCNYDIMFGTENCVTPFKYEINYRNYFLLTEGSAQIKLSPPKSSRYLSEIKDYENFEFRSMVNPWNVQPEYIADFSKIKCLEITLLPGKVIFIPAFWWYSIRFQKSTSISCFRYRTYMNNIAISNYIAMYILQIQNVKRNVVKKVNIESLNTLNHKNMSNDDTYVEKNENDIIENNVVKVENKYDI